MQHVQCCTFLSLIHVDCMVAISELFLPPESTCYFEFTLQLAGTVCSTCYFKLRMFLSALSNHTNLALRQHGRTVQN